MRQKGVPTDRTIIRRAETRDIPDMATVLSRAFHDDPILHWVFPDDEHRDRRVRDAYAVQLRNWFLPHGVAYVAVRDGALCATALWVPPERRRVPVSVQIRLLPRMLQLTGRRIGRLNDVMRTVTSTRPAEPHWYFAELAVEPGSQRSGLGDRLIRTHLARCDADGLTAHGECLEKNIRYYEPYGFSVTATSTLPFGETLFTVSRKPRVP
ncbi:GNAT family N-acetyltransferase [Streptomyces polyrhachis]|uniref:GNAT family N-acetyltransferase n=1 Tax=Streptomyces polyrhachis TaxID=1282885 RepID=A0ABW2GJ49_9ACTN